VPGSFPRRVGILPASAIATTAVWLGPAVVALVLGSLSGGADVAESGRSGVRRAQPSMAGACAIGGFVAVVFAWWMTR
jgi:hypothetical protein